MAEELKNITLTPVQRDWLEQCKVIMPPISTARQSGRSTVIAMFAQSILNGDDNSPYEVRLK